MQAKKMFSSSPKKTFFALTSILCVTVLGLTACGSNPVSNNNQSDSSGNRSSITFGAADFPESQALAEIYAGVLARNGYEAKTKTGIGTREVYLKALDEGSIDAVPEYTGNLLLALKPKATQKTADEIKDALGHALPTGQSILTPSSAEDKDALVVTSAFAEQHNLKSIENLSSVCSDVSLGAPPEFKSRSYGLPGLKDNYKCEPKEFKALNDSGGNLTVEALKKGDVQVADIFTSSPSIDDNGFVVLDDPKNNFIAQQVVPLVKDEKFDSHSKELLNKVSDKLSTQSLTDLNREMSGNTKKSPHDAASKWLDQNGFTEQSSSH